MRTFLGLILIAVFSSITGTYYSFITIFRFVFYHYKKSLYSQVPNKPGNWNNWLDSKNFKFSLTEELTAGRLGIVLLNLKKGKYRPFREK